MTARAHAFFLSLIIAAGAYAGSEPGIYAQRVTQGFSLPIFVTPAPGDNRLFVVEQGGRVRIVSGGAIEQQDFIDLSGVVRSGGERGLLGMAFHPNYQSNRFVYFNFTQQTGVITTSTFIARFTAAPDGNTADLASRFDIIEYNQPFSNHNAGWFDFGPDGFMYIPTGDGGSANDSLNSAQRLNTLLGKILRIDVDVGSPYVVPASNPFIGVEGAFIEIWAYGLRNPFRCSFDRETGDLWLGDVGQSAREEVKFQPASRTGGENYGWKVAEGFACLGGSGTCGTDPEFTPPIHDYPNPTVGQSVTGGYVYRGKAIPELQGLYIFGDFVSRRIFTLDRNTKGAPVVVERTADLIAGDAANVDGLPTFGEDNFGELYFTSYRTGELFKIRRTVSIADVNGDSTANASDIQLVINAVLSGSGTNEDIDNDGTVNSVDVQLAINGVLGIL